MFHRHSDPSGIFTPPLATICGPLCFEISRRALGAATAAGAAPERRRPSPPPEFWDWLAGLIDGDGHLRPVGVKGGMLEITVGLEDRPLLEYLAATLGVGVLRRRSPERAFRFGVYAAADLRWLLGELSGRLRGVERLPQLERLCDRLEVTFRPPGPLAPDSGWYAGFFDADGHLGLRFRPGRPGGSASVTLGSKFSANLAPFRERFGGPGYGPYGNRPLYYWTLAAEEPLRAFAAYARPRCRSCRSRRFGLLPAYYELRRQRVYADPAHPLRRRWRALRRLWAALDPARSKAAEAAVAPPVGFAPSPFGPVYWSTPRRKAGGGLGAVGPALPGRPAGGG